MNVALLHTLPAEGRTSSEVYADELASALRRLDRDVHVIDVRPQSRLRRAFGGSRLAGYADRYGLYQLMAGRVRADVVHIVDHGYAHLALTIAARPVVVTYHDAVIMRIAAGELPESGSWRLTLAAHQLSLAGLGRAARVIVPSNATRRDLLRFTRCDPQRVRVILEGVAERFAPAVSASTRTDLRVLHVGHCAAYKNIETILRALPQIRRRTGRSVTFVKVGGPFTPQQERLIRDLDIASAVHHLGVVPPDELPLQYAEADVLLMPSLHEGFGLPILEAMASGIPVVAGARGALPEVVGDAGLLVDPTDVDAVAAATARVLCDASLREDLRRRGLGRSRAFTWDRTASRTLAVYEEALASTTRPPRGRAQ